ncbi:transketolase family protein [Amycolatopsis acidicola]|uniref:Transketolase family protein n=1 Tax=Amycolatopsis acidicola TaxID=2596893 RepID=A0A5N0UZV1_9PSEU|nr:transketolase C-terminal domain-containing protein [Amycolatopsis acidicola]KAA9159613.1 transketolase family protein [Amycolatopsis acidicola]
MTSVVVEPACGSTAWVERYGLSAVDTCRLAQLHAADRDGRVFSLEGDLGDFGGLRFAERYPGRFLDMGIAEASLIGAAAGLALRGKVAFVNTFGSFALMRACEQVRLDVAYHRTNVKIAGTFTGVAAGFSGPTHHCGEDLAVARSLPGMTVLAPADAVSAYQLTLAAAQLDGPVYLRLGVEATPQVYDENATFEIGRGNVLAEGADVTLVAAGLTTVATVLEAARQLAARGVHATVIDLHTIKPVDEELLVRSAKATGLVVTVEEHSTIGGLGGAVADVLAGSCPVPMRMLGLPDAFAHDVGSYADQLARCGLDVPGVRAAVESALRRWK